MAPPQHGPLCSTRVFLIVTLLARTTMQPVTSMFCTTVPSVVMYIPPVGVRTVPAGTPVFVASGQVDEVPVGDCGGAVVVVGCVVDVVGAVVVVGLTVVEVVDFGAVVVVLADRRVRRDVAASARPAVDTTMATINTTATTIAAATKRACCCVEVPSIASPSFVPVKASHRRRAMTP